MRLTKKTGTTSMMASKTPEDKAMINPKGRLEADLHVEAEGEAMPKAEANTTISLKMGGSMIITKVEMAKASEGAAGTDRPDAGVVGAEAGLLLHVVMAILRVKIAKVAAALMIVEDKHSNLCHPPMLEASKAVLTHGTIPMRITGMPTRDPRLAMTTMVKVQETPMAT